MIQRYPTRRRSLINRLSMKLWYSMQRSWAPAICFYVVVCTALIVINYKG